MIDQLIQRENYVLAKKLLDVAHSKHQALASNISNAETPGYKRQDIRTDFTAQLQKAAATNDVSQIDKLQPTVVADLNSPNVRPDGNNVQIDRELLQMTDNATQYEFLAEYTSNSLKRLKTAITGRVE